MAFDASSLSAFGSISCAEHDSIRCADVEIVAKPFSWYRFGKKKRLGQNGRVPNAASDLSLVSPILICSKSSLKVCGPFSDLRFGHHHALEAQNAAMVLLSRKIQTRISSELSTVEGKWLGKYSLNLASLDNVTHRRRRTQRNVDASALKRCALFAGLGLQGDCRSCRMDPLKRKDTIVTAAATGSDQTSPSQNGGGERGLPKKPHPEVDPSLVVQAQLKALHEKDLPMVYEFASPANKAHTGPLARFTEILEGRPYKVGDELLTVMLGHVSAEVLSTISISPTRFQQRITITGVDGNAATFLWSLSKQEEGPYDGCWMTDTVRRDEY